MRDCPGPQTNHEIMTDKQIELLRKQLDSLQAKDFNLDAWKTSTKLVLERIFGPGNPKAREIEKIHYDLSSWSLRDSLGAASTLEGCKRTARAILDACILELETLGDAGQAALQKTIDANILAGMLENHLTVARLRKLREIAQAEKGQADKVRDIREFLEGLGEEEALDMLSEFLAEPGVSSQI